MANHLNSVVKSSPTAEAAMTADVTPTSLDDLLGCKFCLAIWGGVAALPDEQKQWTAECSLKEALSAECSRHKPIFRCMENLSDIWNKTVEYLDIHLDFTVPGPGKLRALTMVSQSDGRHRHGGTVELELVRRVDVLDHPGIARVLDPLWINVSVVEQWLKRCIEAHGTRCENPLKIWSARPAWVIDTLNKCLIPGEKCPSYVALSYRWGRAPGLQIREGLMSVLQRPNALNDPAISSQIAPLVRHAIELVPKIGQRYLWADTLCIDHSQPGESTEQLQLMAAIYANATLTIIGSNGDAEDGLLGLRGVSSPLARDLSDTSVPFGQETFSAVDRKAHIFWPTTQGSSSLYHERGWTYQEFHMSSRRLIFKDNSLHWMCQCSEWPEHLYSAIEPHIEFEEAHMAIGELTRGIPSLRSFGKLIPNKYNQRTLTYDEDALPAINGMLSVLSRCFSGGFLYGIPEMFFEAALSWKAEVRTWSDLDRRKTSKRSNPTLLHPCGLPSWSWLGWRGRVQVGQAEAGTVHWPPEIKAGVLDLWGPMKETIPITTWYTCSSPTAMHKRRINNWWFENREAYKDFEKPLPPGWTRHEASKAPGPHEIGTIFPEGCGQYTFRHSSMTEENDSWHWPFPVPDIHESTQPLMPEQTQYICCETHLARVFAFWDGEYSTLAMTLYSETRGVIGELYLHHIHDREHFPEPWEGREWDASKPVELVAICRERHYKMPGKGEKSWEKRIQTGLFKRWETYTVLWVEWKDGVAYRLASGEVNREAWEGLALEEISLILG